MIKDNDYYNNLDKDSSEYRAFAKFNNLSNVPQPTPSFPKGGIEHKEFKQLAKENLVLSTQNAILKYEYDNLKDQNIIPSDEEIEKRAEYMQRPRNTNNDIKEEFIYGYMQGADWIINKLKQ